jgi:uncharacterized protein YfaS (alpha-2-macroglobulin family)
MRLWTRIALLALAIAPLAASGDSSPQVILATPGIGGGAIERFTLRFSQAMVPLGDPRPAAPATVECAIGGEGRWVDQQTWVWEFATGLPGGTTCTVKTREGLRSAAGYELPAQRSFTVDAGGPTARAVLPSGSGDEIEEDQAFLVAANMPATPASVAANAYCAVDGIGEKIPVRVLGPEVPGKLLGAMGSDDWQTRNFLENGGLPTTVPTDAATRARALASVVALQCGRPLPPGRDVSLVWGAGIAGANGKTAGADQRFDFTVRKPFAARFECSRVNAQAGCSPVEKAYVRFSAPVPMSAAKGIRIALPDGKTVSPTFSDDDKKRATISDVAFAPPFAAGVAGTLTLPAGVKDESGRTLSNAERFPLAIRFDQAPPLVKFAAPFGILEAKEGGVLPVTVRNVEPALQGRNLTVALQGRNLTVAGQSLRVEGGDGAVADWLRKVDKADDSNVEEVRDAKGEVVRRINHTGDKAILSEGAALTVGLPGKGRAFEVVGIPLSKPGFYVVELASPVLGEALLGRKAPRYVAAAALVTNLSVHFKWGREKSLAWVTELDSGKPAANAEIRVTDSCTGKLLARGVTDRSGGLMVPPGLPEPQTYGGCEYESSPHPLMVSARRGDDMSFALTEWGEGIRPYDFDLPYGYSARGEIVHTVFDRALVRQGETVHMKHIVRQPDGSGFTIPPGFTGTLRLAHRGSETVFEMPLAIGADGVGETSWAAPQGAPMGDYDLRFVKPDGTTVFTEQSFRVDEYRLPTMRATVTGPKDPAVRPRSLPVDLYAGYLSGGGAANLAVDVRVAYTRRDSAPDGYETYTFGGRAIAEGVKPLNGDGEEEQAPLPPVQLLPATLGANGARRQTIDVPALDGAADMTVEMDYQDANGQTLTASRVIPILPSRVQLGVKTDGWLMKQDDLRLRFVALDPAGKPIEGQKITVALYSRQILTARRRLIGGFYAYDNQVRTEKLSASCTPTTDAQGLAQCAVDPGVSGEVYAVATATDADGNTSRAVRSVWLAGDDDWWFGGDNGDRMDVVAEQQSYKAGETARFQVRMPFREATALVTVEREGVLSSFTTHLSGTDPVVEVKMPGAYAPDVFVSVLAVRGRVQQSWWGWFKGLFGAREEAPAPTALVDLSKPAYRLGIAKVKVGWEAHTLQVKVAADKPRYAARETANVAIEVRDPSGKPARQADVAFAAVDQALLQLAPNESWNVLTAMMGERPLSVLTSTAQTQVVGKRHHGRKAVEAGGGGGADMSAVNRENFQPVLLWRGRVPLDANGRARVPVQLNDALSSFKLVAIATDGAQLYGTGTADIRTAQDLSIYAGLPPLVRTGDAYSGVFTLRNGSARPMTVTAEVALSPQIARGKPITVTIPAGGAAPVAWNLAAPSGQGTIRWQVSARAADGRAADRVTATQELVPAVPVETWAATLARIGDTRIPITPPSGALVGFGSVDIALSDTLAPPMAGVRRFMAAYPYTCFEQRMSRAVALGDPAGWTQLAAEIPTYQAPDGLLRYWPSDTLDGSEALTAYVLSLAGEAGLAIPEASKTRMVEGLKAVLDGRLRHESYGDVRLQRLAAFTALARAGAATSAMIDQVGLTNAEMPTSGLADWIMAVDRIPGLANAADLRAAGEAELRRRFVYEGTRVDLTDQSRAPWWLMQSADEGALKALLAVVGRPGWQDDGPRLMVGVAQRQARGRWDTTTANAWGTLAVAKFARTYPATAIAGTTTLALGGRQVAKGWPLDTGARLASFPLPAAPTPLLLRQSGGAGPWASVSVRAAVPLRQPLSAGYRLSRQVEVVQRRVAGRLTRGDVVKVTLTVDASAERNWVVVDDPIPAGATIVGDLGGQSKVLADQASGGDGVKFGSVDGDGKLWEVQAGVMPAYVERTNASWRGYYAWVPRGRFQASYMLRLNGAGRFHLPPSKVEAMYSPAIRAMVPNADVTVAAR